MQGDDYKTQIRSGFQPGRWYTRLRRLFRGLGCLCCDWREIPVYLMGYVPVGRLHRTAGVGAINLVDSFLTSREYYVDQRDRRSRSALHYASTHDHPEVVSFLISKNCNVNALDDEKSTPLIKACQWENEECVSILLRHGADPNAVDKHGNNTLHYAVLRGNILIVEQLLTHNADIEARTKCRLDSGEPPSNELSAASLNKKTADSSQLQDILSFPMYSSPIDDCRECGKVTGQPPNCAEEARAQGQNHQKNECDTSETSEEDRMEEQSAFKQDNRGMAPALPFLPQPPGQDSS